MTLELVAGREPETGEGIHEQGGYALRLECCGEDQTWRGAQAWRLETFQPLPLEGQAPEATRFAARLLEVLHSMEAMSMDGAGIQLGLDGDPVGGQVRVGLILEAEGPDPHAVIQRADTIHRAVRQVTAQSPLFRLAAVATVPEFDGVVGRGWIGGRCAEVPCTHLGMAGNDHLWLGQPRVPGGSATLDEVVSLLLTDSAATTVRISLSVHRRVPGLDVRRKQVSTALAWARARSQGIQFHGARPQAVSRVFPEDLVRVEEFESDLELHAAWLRELAEGAVLARVDVLGREKPSLPLLHAVQRALVGARQVRWVELSEEQASLISRGPLGALECPSVAAELETVAAQDWLDGAGIGGLLPLSVAARALALPLPGRDGIPGLPVDPVRERPLPAMLAPRVTGGLLGLGCGHQGEVPVRVPGPDLARHLYVCGKTGTGKSTLLRSLCQDLAAQGEGVGAFDPHGGVVRDLVSALRWHRDVVVFDPTDPECPGLDPLWHDGSPEGQERAVESITDTMYRLYKPEFMGPMFDRFSRALLLPLVRSRRSLSDVSRMASCRSFRKECLARLDAGDPLDEEILRFWNEEHSAWGSNHIGEMQTYTVSKYDALLRSSALRRACAPDRPQLDLRGIVDRGAVLLVRLPQGTLGPVSAWFLGMLLVSRLLETVFSRSDLAEIDRRPFTLLLDEFQHFLGGRGFGSAERERALAPLLSEARKFGLRLVLANQYVSQLDSETREAIFGNVGSTVVFRVGAQDAEYLARELGGDQTAGELRNLPLFQAVARVLRDGKPSPRFTLRTVPPGWMAR